MCPDENLLARFAGGVPDAGLELHLDTCADCRRAVAAAASDETLAAPAPEGALAEGAPLGRYRVLRQVGAGGMGAVYAAVDPKLERQVAIKVLRAGGGSDERLVREARAMAKLSHPNLMPIFELGESFIVMELVDGSSLKEWSRTAKKTEVQAALLEAGKGLCAAHAAAVVHRDFKPANVLVGRDGRVRVTDFGLARDDGATAPGSMFETQAGTVLGTPAYMAPEQLDGQLADARSDQFAFAVAWVEAVTGERPFDGKTVAELRAAMRDRAPKLPREHRAALAKALAIDPAARHASMQALLDALQPKKRRAWLALPIAAALGLAAFAATRGEEEVTVMVAKVDVREGTPMRADMMTEAKIPKRLVTTSVVRPKDKQYVVDVPLQVPVQAGDVLLWSAFEEMP